MLLMLVKLKLGEIRYYMGPGKEDHLESIHAMIPRCFSYDLCSLPKILLYTNVLADKQTPCCVLCL